jgi:hypothetical protein
VCVYYWPKGIDGLASVDTIELYVRFKSIRHTLQPVSEDVQL